MTSLLKVAAVALMLPTACLAQQSLVTVSSKNGQKWSAAEVDKIYLSACSAVHKEFGGICPLAPRVALVLGANKNGVDFEKKEVCLVRWDPDFFAQGVVTLTFWDLMTPERRMAIAKRALADATVEAPQIPK